MNERIRPYDPELAKKITVTGQKLLRYCMSKMNEQLMIKNKYNRIQKKLKSVQSELEWLQRTCEHPNADVKHRGDRGNYDPSMDRYWIEYTCPDCGKFWTEDK